MDDLLEVSRITRGKIRLECRELDLAEVVERAVETVRPLVESKAHDLKVTLPARPVLANASVQ